MVEAVNVPMAVVEDDDELATATSSDKIAKYQEAKSRWISYLNVTTEATLAQKQLRLSEILSDIFRDEMSFVGFYDKREDNDEKIFIGEYVSNADIFPCGEINMGAGQCGQCAAEQRTLIAHDTKQLENYIACDMHTRSEIVVPCCSQEDGQLLTVLDIDSPNVGNFTEEDRANLEDLVYMIYQKPTVSWNEDQNN